MREIRTSGSVRGEGGNTLAYSTMGETPMRRNAWRRHCQRRQAALAWDGGRVVSQWAMTLETRKTGSSSAMAMVPMMAPRMVIMSGSISVITLRIDASNFFS